MLYQFAKTGSAETFVERRLVESGAQNAMLKEGLDRQR
jgi:hypothetical protein